MEKQNMTKRIQELASSYVPEWKMDTDNPDIGTALAIVYGQMMESVEERYSHMMEKKQIDFLNAIGSDLAPAACAKGYVSFGLPDEQAEPERVPAKTYVTADSEEADSGKIYYETREDILVIPASLSCMYEIDPAEDYVGMLYDDLDKKESTSHINAVLFQNTVPDMQEHELYIGHKELFDIAGDSWFCLSLYQQGNLSVKEELLKYLADPELVEITYCTEEGFLPFYEVMFQQGKLWLHRKENMPLFCKTCLLEDNVEQFYLKIRAKQIKPLEALRFQRMEIAAVAKNQKPDLVIVDGMEADLHKYFPFGERLSVYNEVYFASNDLLGKHGASLTLSFQMHFEAIPLDTSEEAEEIKWEWIMKEEDFARKKEYDVSIASVIWEYYNGTGWARLFKDHSYETVFTPQGSQNGMSVKISFACPMDMEQAFIGTTQAYAIRARIVKMNHPYQLNGVYISPVLEQTSLSMDYLDNPVQSFHVLTWNSQQKKTWSQDSCVPFTRISGSEKSLYLGFDKPLKGGPLKLYFQFREAIVGKEGSFAWEYWNGRDFQKLNVIDGTGSFQKSGVVTFLGPDQFPQSSLFGRARYWIRIVDASGYYSTFYENGKKEVTAPFLEAVIPNTVKIENREPEQTEYFQMEYHVKQKLFRLQQKNIQSIHVYVKEKVIGKTEPEWIEWKQVLDFIHSDEQSEHYMADQNEGVIMFGNGSKGKVPPVSREDNIKVVYQCGGGFYGNVGVGDICKLRKNIGFIQKVKNPLPMSGGLDKETKSHAIKRCCAQIRMCNRAVTSKDYEALAMEASRRVEKAWCFRGIDGQGKPVHGAITLVLLIKDYKMGSSVFQGVQNNVKEYLKGKMPDTVYYAGKLSVVEPFFVTCHVKAVLCTDDFDSVFYVQDKAKEQLSLFFDPLEGNVDHKGWEMGNLPKLTQLQNLLYLIDHVVEIRSLLIQFYRIGRNGYEEVTKEEMEQCPFTLPVNGTHQISIES